MEKNRPVTITTASLAFIVFGAVTLVYAILIAVALITYSTISQTGLVVFGVMMFLVALIGVLDIVAGYGLWHMKRWASIMGMLLAIFGLIAGSFFYMALGATYYSYGYSALASAGGGLAPSVDLVLVFLIGITWKSFEP